MNIILIVSDTLRRDHLGCYGNKTIRTPNLDRFAERSLQIEHCYAASFPTMPMRADIFTGKFTFTYLGWAPLPRGERVLAQFLSEEGYTTIAVVDTPFFTAGDYNYDRGFQDFIRIRGQRRGDRSTINYERRYEEDYCAPMTMHAAERWLERHYKEKFFLYVDTWDPHEPWDPPPWYVELYQPNYDGRVVRPCYGPWREHGLKKEDVKLAHACYCGEVTMVDRWVGRLLDRIESLGLWDDTAILFTADHGFYFGEHELFGKLTRGKGRGWRWSPLYQEISRVPLLIHVPGIKPRRSEVMVSSPDLMPTILELAGVKIPDTVQAQSIVSYLSAGKRKGREFVVTSMPLCQPGDKTRAVDNWVRKVEESLPATITTREWTLLYGMEGKRRELYSLKDDPGQRENVARVKKNRKVVKSLHQRFVKLLEKCGTDEHYLAPRRHL